MARCIAIAKNRRSAVIYVSSGLACLPRDTGGTRTTAEVRLYKHTTRRMHSRQRRVTPNNPIRTTHTAEGAWGIVPLWEMRFEDALLPIRRQIKTAEVRLYMLARGWLAYPVTPVAHALPPKCGCINTHMYTIINIQNKNRRSAVSYVSTGLARLPRDTGGTRTTAEVRLYKKKKWNPASRWIPSLKKSYTPYFVNFKTVLSLNFNT